MGKLEGKDGRHFERVFKEWADHTGLDPLVEGTIRDYYTSDSTIIDSISSKTTEESVNDNNNAIPFDDYIGLEGDPPKTVRNKDGKALDPNGNICDLSDAWYAAVIGNLVMTNGTDYQAWDQGSGTYKAGRPPRAYFGSRFIPYDRYPTDFQIGDIYKQYSYDPRGIDYFNSNDWCLKQYIGGNSWILLEDFRSKKVIEVVTWVFPIGGSVKGGTVLLK